MIQTQAFIKTGITLLFVFISITSSTAQELLKFESDQKYGFKDANGKEIVPAVYTWVNTYSEGLAAVYQGGKIDDNGILGGGKWGFIDPSGKVIIPFSYDNVTDFYDGMASVVIFINNRYGTGKWGFIDKTGKLVIPFQFDNLAYFKDGSAEVEEDGNKYYIDKSGKKVTSNQDISLSTIEIVDDVFPTYKFGGIVELNNFIRENMLYNENYENATAYIEIIIGIDGKVNDAKILRGINEKADTDLLRVIKMLEFVPEVRDNKAVGVKYILTYKL